MARNSRFLLVAAIFAVAAELPSADPVRADVAAIVEDILSDASYQRELLFGREQAAAGGEAPPDRRGSSTERELTPEDLEEMLDPTLPDQRSPSDSPSTPSWTVKEPPGPASVSPIARLVLWICVSVLGAIAAIWLLNAVSRRRSEAEPADAVAMRTAAVDPAGDRPTLSVADALAAADRLAADGRHGDAVRQLLFSVLRALDGTAARPRRSLTSREVISQSKLAGDARSALAAIINKVEISHFGTAMAAGGDYRDCRRHCEVVLQAIGAKS